MNSHTTTDAPAERRFAALIVGAGPSGIGAAIRLRKAGIDDFAVLEKASELGGTWRDNTYPGCACDVPSVMYQFSFAPNPDWARTFARQPEIRAYVTATAERFGIPPHLHLGVEVTRAQWDAEASRWTVRTTQGTYSAPILIAAAGPWHEPLVPEIPGIESFPGTVFHSARWDHDVDLSGKRVAVVGTGASAVQFVPEIQPRVGRLELFQRTAQWVLPKPDAALPRPVRWLMGRVPGLQRASRAVSYLAMEGLGLGFRHPQLLRIVQQVGVLHLRLRVGDPALRRTLRPDYTLGCKRLLMSNRWYQALSRENVGVHPTAVERVEGATIVGRDGTRVDADVLVFGTGFHITDAPVAGLVFDADGRSLDDHWGGSMKAYLGTTISGFPNLFLVLGPNLGTGHSSAFDILEAQVDYAIAAITTIRDRGWAAIDVRAEVQEAYNGDVQGALGGTVYNAGGCQSYYMDVNGRNSFSWPWSTGEMKRRLGRFDPDAYRVTVAAGQPATV